MRFFTEGELERFYRDRLDLYNYPLPETELTAEDVAIWAFRLPLHFSNVGNLVAEARDAEYMSALCGAEQFEVR